MFYGIIRYTDIFRYYEYMSLKLPSTKNVYPPAFRFIESKLKPKKIYIGTDYCILALRNNVGLSDSVALLLQSTGTHSQPLVLFW